MHKTNVIAGRLLQCVCRTALPGVCRRASAVCVSDCSPGWRRVISDCSALCVCVCVWSQRCLVRCVSKCFRLPLQKLHIWTPLNEDILQWYNLGRLACCRTTLMNALRWLFYSSFDRRCCDVYFFSLFFSLGRKDRFISWRFAVLVCFFKDVNW